MHWLPISQRISYDCSTCLQQTKSHWQCLLPLLTWTTSIGRFLISIASCRQPSIVASLLYPSIHPSVCPPVCPTIRHQPTVMHHCSHKRTCLNERMKVIAFVKKNRTSYTNPASNGKQDIKSYSSFPFLSFIINLYYKTSNLMDCVPWLCSVLLNTSFIQRRWE